jgi:hypothetical protein
MALTARFRWHRCLAPVVALTLGCLAIDTSAQTATPQRPRQAKPQPSRPATQKPAPSATKPVEPVKPPAPPPPEDVRFKSVYTTGEQRTETVTFIKGPRERYEFQDMVLLKQHDQKRTVQISRAANTYLVAPEGMPVSTGPTPAAPPRVPGVITVATTIVDTGERKAAFGQQARRVKVTIDKQPMPGACDTSKQRIETDGWYIDAPVAVANRSAAGSEQATVPGDCVDQTQATINGDPKALGFPIAYKTTVTGDDGEPVVATMDVTEFELTTLDAALFEIPAGLNAAMNLRDLSKTLSDVNEAKLAAAAAAPAPTAKAPGVIRIGVPELTNKTTHAVDTRALRQRLIGDLADAKFDAVPMAAAASPAELQKRAGELGYDYILLADVSELKASKPSRLGGLMGAASGIAGGRAGVTGAAAGAANTTKETTESTIAVRLVQPDGKQRLSTTAKGKDGSGFSLKAGLGIAKFAGGMYLSMMAGPMMMSRLNSMGAANMGGMGMLGNPLLYRMQGAGLGGLGTGTGMDATAGAASFLMGTALEMNDLGGYVGLPGQGPSYDESLGEAIRNAAKAVQKALEKK